MIRMAYPANLPTIFRKPNIRQDLHVYRTLFWRENQAVFRKNTRFGKEIEMICMHTKPIDPVGLMCYDSSAQMLCLRNHFPGGDF